MAAPDHTWAGGLLARADPYRAPHDSGSTLLESINVSHFWSASKALIDRKADVIVLQETCLALGADRAAGAWLAEQGWDSCFGPPDPDMAAPNAGVGIMTKRPLITCVPPRATDEIEAVVGPACRLGTECSAFHVFAT